MDKPDGYLDYIIPYVLPGFLALWFVASFDTVSARWLASVTADAVTVGGFLFAVLASLGLGIFINGLRWQLLEQLLFRWRRLGVPEAPEVDAAARRDFAQPLADVRATQYRFFQFYGNAAVALAFALVVVLLRAPAPITRDTGALLVAFAFVEWILLASARSCLQKYRARLSQLGRRSLEAA